MAEKEPDTERAKPMRIPLPVVDTPQSSDADLTREASKRAGDMPQEKD